MNRLIIFVLTFFTPTGFNYMYLGQKKKGILFLMLFFVASGAIATSIFNGWLNHFLAFGLILATNVVVLYDCLSTRKKLKHKLKVSDSLDGVIAFLKQNALYVILIGATIISITVVSEIEFEVYILNLIAIRVAAGLLIVEIIFMIVKSFVYVADKDNSKVYEEIAMQKANRESSAKIQKTLKDENAIKLLKDGYTQLDMINELERSLESTSISRHISEISKTITKILNFVEEHPDKARQLKKFMDYYLPTTVKLINNYSQYKQNPNGKNVEQGLSKIETIMSTVEKAFKSQLDNLFEDKTLDLVSEINVLDTMLKTEGLVE